MSYTEWVDELNTGISEIDDQHRQLVSYLNQLYDAIQENDKSGIAAVLDETIDYTVFHFSFEESIMEQMDYEFYLPHQRIHELFKKRVVHYKERFERGEDIADELHALLKRWLVNHILHDDKNFARATTATMATRKRQEKGFLAWLRSIFR